MMCIFVILIILCDVKPIFLIFNIRYLKVAQQCVRMGLVPEFHVNFGSGRVGSLKLWVGSGRVKKIGPTFNFSSMTMNIDDFIY